MAVTPTAPGADAPDAPAAPALTLAADTRSVRQASQERTVMPKKSSTKPEAKKNKKKPTLKRPRKVVGKLPATPDKAPIEAEIQRFCTDLDGLLTTLPFLAVAVDALFEQTTSRYNTFLDKKGTLLGSSGEMESYAISPMDHDRLSTLRRQLEGVAVTSKVLPRSFIVALVSEYDCFLSRVLSCLFDLQPELLTPSARVLTFAQLKEFKTVEAATAFLVEKEIESVLRKSHADQFKWLEKRFGLTLTTGLEVWPAFIEVTERRNLFAHCDGLVSSQYLEVCGNHGVLSDEAPEVGQQLEVTPDYFASAHASILEVGVKLAQVLWRKVYPQGLEEADRSLVVTSYELIVREQYPLAVALLEFAENTLKKHSSDGAHRKLVINLAQTYKWLHRPADCAALLARYDWSAVKPMFGLAVAVLEDRFADAAPAMLRIGPKGDVSEPEYRLWPLFQEFRKSKEFLEAYAEVFGHPYEEAAEEAERVPDVKGEQEEEKCS